MAVYGATNCDEAGSFTNIITTGDGVTGFDNVHQQEGVACFYTEFGGLAGTAYGFKTLDANIGDGNYFHIGGKLWFAREWDFMTPNVPVLADNQVCLSLYDTVGGASIWFFMRTDGDLDADGKFKWYLACSFGGGITNLGTPGWSRAGWKHIHIYGYAHNTEGWLQMWEDSVLHCEVTGIDTYPGSDWDRLVLGAAFEGAPANEICYVFDDFVVNDEASPLPPGSGDGIPLARGIISPWYHNQRDCKGATGLIDVS